MKRPAIVLVFLLLLCASYPAQPRSETRSQSLSEKTAGMQKFPGYFPFYWDAKAGKIWLEIDKWNSEFLYVESLPAGIGSNDIGLDRGQLGQDYIVRFERIGPKVLLIAANQGYRAVSDNGDERRAVKDAFAESTLWGFEVAAEEGNRALVDATNFYLRDVHGVPGTLQRNQQGQFRLDPTRCAFYLANTRNFPKNTEVETTLTFTTDGEAGPLVRSVTPNAQAITVREHVSFVELPGPGFKPRENDPRAGYFGIQFMDFAMPISDPITRRYISHHRLQKKDPSAAMSDPVEPIVYYVDRGAPEPVRSALIEGASWWNQAFEAAGYRNAFRVQVMPPDADPMDVRYNVIQWVHRSTRGWSYGSSLEDPRTGEIIQGRVSLGSLRDRQDFLIAQGLLAPYGKDKSVVDKIMQQVVLARLRQLAAHEVGHTLGLQHNFAASTTNRASVMDYPAPLVKLGADGLPDLSDAYAKGIGEWDKVAIAYGYQDFPAGTNEPAALDKILRDAFDRGLRYLTDQDARPPGASSSYTHLWDNGENVIDGLANLMKVRSAALARFGENNIREGAPMATLEDVLVAEERRPGEILDHEFINQHTTGFANFKDALAGVHVGDILEQSGITKTKIEDAARVFLESDRVIFCWAMGLTQHKNAVANIQEIVNLMMLRGQLGKPGAGLCPVRGHSNVQGDRTMGIWEQPSEDFLDKLAAQFHFQPPRRHGLDTVHAIQAMHEGQAKVFFALGGNFLSATPDTEYTAEALRRCQLTAHVSTKLNRAHVITGKQALILPCLGRTEIDQQANGRQFVTTENSMAVVEEWRGTLPPASEYLLSEPAIVAGLAKATLGNRSTVDWDSLVANYDHIRARIEQVVPGFENYNERVRQPGGFYLPNPIREREFNTKDGRAHFTIHPLPDIKLGPDEFLMMTMRSHDQFNTTIYGLDDRYRGIYNGRRVVFLNADDISLAGLQAGQLVDLISRFHGEERIARAFRIVSYSIPRRCAATYFPEANVLVPIDHFADKSHTPASKSVVIAIRPAN